MTKEQHDDLRDEFVDAWINATHEQRTNLYGTAARYSADDGHFARALKFMERAYDRDPATVDGPSDELGDPATLIPVI